MYNFHANEGCNPYQRETKTVFLFYLLVGEKALEFLLWELVWSLYYNELSLKLSYPRRHKFYVIKKMQEFFFWRDGLAVKSINYSCRGPRSDSYQPHGSSQKSITAVSKVLMIFSDICRHQTCMWGMHIHMEAKHPCT